MADWSASLPRGRRAAEGFAWTLSGLAVAAAIAGAVALALHLERLAGNETARDQAMLIDLPPVPPPPAATATPEAAPDQPMVDVPETEQPTEISETTPDMPEQMEAPDTAPPPDQLNLAQLPDLPMDSLAPPPPPPEPVAKKEPEQRVEEKPVEHPKPKVEKKQPPKPSVSSRKTAAKSSATGQGEVSVNKGQLKDLKASWGATIRKRIERRKSYPAAAGNASGTATVRLTVTRSGGLAGLSLARSSGNSQLDDAALNAVRAAGSFPAAPAALGDASYVFTLPINFSR